jgi:hypothetical protein
MDGNISRKSWNHISTILPRIAWNLLEVVFNALVPRPMGLKKLGYTKNTIL